MSNFTPITDVLEKYGMSSYSDRKFTKPIAVENVIDFSAVYNLIAKYRQPNQLRTSNKILFTDEAAQLIVDHFYLSVSSPSVWFEKFKIEPSTFPFSIEFLKLLSFRFNSCSRNSKGIPVRNSLVPTETNLASLSFSQDIPSERLRLKLSPCAQLRSVFGPLTETERDAADKEIHQLFISLIRLPNKKRVDGFKDELIEALFSFMNSELNSFSSNFIKSDK